MLKQRIVTAFFIAAVFLSALVFLSPYHFSLVTLVVVTYAAWEWSDLSGISGLTPRLIYALSVLALLLGSGWYLGLLSSGTVDLDVSKTLMLWLTPWWAVALLWVQGYPSSAVLWGNRWVRGVIGYLVLVPAWLALVILIHASQGGWLILIVVLVVALADIGAYFSGRLFGRHKLAANVSPKKTWELITGRTSPRSPQKVYLQPCFSRRCFWRPQSRLASVSRLSWFFLPLAMPILSFTMPL